MSLNPIVLIKIIEWRGHLVRYGYKIAGQMPALRQDLRTQAKKPGFFTKILRFDPEIPQGCFILGKTAIL